MSNPNDLSTSSQAARSSVFSNATVRRKKKGFHDIRPNAVKSHLNAKKKLVNIVTTKELDELENALAAGDTEVARLILSVSDPEMLEKALKKLAEDGESD